MANDLSPGYLRVRYSGAQVTHFQTIPVEPVGTVTIGNEPNFLDKSGATVAMHTFVDAYVAAVKTLVSAAVTFVDAEFWSQPTPADNPVWIYTHPLTVVGTNATASVTDRQISISYRTSQGGLAFFYLLDVSGAIGADSRQNFPTAQSIVNTFNTFMVSNANCWRGRDLGKLIAPVWFTTKNNDALRKKSLSL